MAARKKQSAPDSLALVAADVAACRRCPRLVDWRESVAHEKRAAYRDWTYWGRGVPGFGDPEARMAIVGLAPAAHGANRTGRMFTGDRSGDFLYAALHRAGLASQPNSDSIDDGMVLNGVYITAAVRCAPPANKPTPDEQVNCRTFFEREVVLLSQLRVFVALGAIGFGAVAGHFGLRPRPKFAHGAQAALPGGQTLLGCFHVSQQNTFTGRLTAETLDAVIGHARHLAWAAKLI